MSPLHQHSQLGHVCVPEPHNEPMRNYAPLSPERTKLFAAIAELEAQLPISVPLVIDGVNILGGSPGATAAVGKQLNPSRHEQTVCTFSLATDEQVDAAIVGAMRARDAWEAMPFVDRAAIFLKAADLLASDKYRYRVMAATMLGQGKNIWQAEIDAACELIDFWRFNVKYAEDMYRQQPTRNAPGTWNTTEYRALEGFVLAVSPFNFTAIGGNLVSAPAMCGNVVVWKPSRKAVLSNYLVYEILREAGLPAGVIQFLPGDDVAVVRAAMRAREFAALHFTGSTNVFRVLWAQAAQQLPHYTAYPRIVGETGGKNMHFVHASAREDASHVVASTLRAAFEYAGQKCSACSRIYVPASLWASALRDPLVEGARKLVVGDIKAASTFVGPVIDEASYDRIMGFIEGIKKNKDGSSGARILVGGHGDKSRGYFIHPTIIELNGGNPEKLGAGAAAPHPALTQELFGPVLAVSVYDDSDFDAALLRAASTSEFALTCAFFGRDRAAIVHARERLRHAAGNFYINDKCTGAVVGQQAFGGARASGTNDKAGAAVNLLRWVSMRTIKESFTKVTEVTYPSNIE